MKKIERVFYDGSTIMEVIMFRNEKIRRKTPIVNGLKHGIEKYYFENGQLNNEVQYKNGNREGYTKQWDEYGNIIFFCHFLNNIVHGINFLKILNLPYKTKEGYIKTFFRGVDNGIHIKFK